MTTIKRWPRIRPHWRRFQRRMCWNCPGCAHLGEPRLLVCSGCGLARYCDEDCQRAHWPLHQGECLAIQEQLKRFVKLQSQVDALKALALSKGADQGMIDAAIAA